MPVPHGFVEKLAELSASGRPFVSVTLVETVGSTPQDVGTKMLVDASGHVFGTVGGGRVENQALGVAQRMLKQRSGPATELLEWNLQRDVGMTCGGTVKLLFEVFNDRGWRVVIFGAGHVAQSLVRVLLQTECQVLCIDPRSEWLEKLPDDRRLSTMVTDDLSGQVAALCDEDFVLCMTMGHRTDRPVLEEIFRAQRQFAYLGVIGSRAKRKILLRELTAAGISREQADQFRCPIGLNLGTNQPGEIAISIAAELIQVRDEQRTAS